MKKLILILIIIFSVNDLGNWLVNDNGVDYEMIWEHGFLVVKQDNVCQWMIWNGEVVDCPININ